MRNIVLTLCCASWIAGCATQEPGGPSGIHDPTALSSFWATTIDFERPMHFTAADGAGLLAPAGQYLVEPTDRWCGLPGRARVQERWHEAAQTW
jgi:hypothetical protein